jgi:dimethylaniline monooxygenase (N-oxide forming)
MCCDQLPRYSASGATSDQGSSVSSLVFQTRIGACLPDLLDRLTDKRLEATSKRVFPVPSEWSFFPAPSNAVTGPLLADEIYALFKSGFAEPVPAAKRVLGSKSVEMVDGRVLTDIDAIIFCTGYETGVPVPLPTEHNPYPVAGQPPHLYRNTFPIHPDPDIRNSLAFLGHAIIPFPGFVLYELNAMCISQVWVGNSFLPSFSEMETWHQQRLRWWEKLLAKQKMKGTTFYATMLPPVDHIKWLDDAAGTGLFKHFGWFSRCSWSFWCNEYELYMKCKYGLFTPVIWRLFNMGKRTVWEKATTQIWEDNELAKQRAKHKKILLERAQ